MRNIKKKWVKFHSLSQEMRVLEGTFYKQKILENKLGGKLHVFRCDIKPTICDQLGLGKSESDILRVLRISLVTKTKKIKTSRILTK